MLNHRNTEAGSDDDSSGSDYVLLEAEEPEEEELADETEQETGPLLAPNALPGVVVAEPSALLLDQIVDETVEANVELDNKKDNQDILKSDENEQEKSIVDDPEEELKLRSCSSIGKEPEGEAVEPTKGVGVTKREESEESKPAYPIDRVEDDIAEDDSEPIPVPKLAEDSHPHSGSDEKDVDYINSNGQDENKSKSDGTNATAGVADPEVAEVAKESVGVAEPEQGLAIEGKPQAHEDDVLSFSPSMVDSVVLVEAEASSSSKSVFSALTEPDEEVENQSGDENKSKSDTTTTNPAGDEEPAGDKEPEPEEMEATKENIGAVKANQDLGSREYKYGTRREVKGAAAVFGVTGLVIGGPVVGVLSAVASAHIAANKPCQCATFTRRCGGVLGKIGNKKQQAAAAPKERKPHLWDKITDRLVEGGEWTEQKFAPLRRIKPLNHKYGSNSKSTST